MEIIDVDTFQTENSIPISENYQTIYSDFSNSHISIAQVYELYEFGSIRYRDYSLTNQESLTLNRTDASPVGINVTDYQITYPTSAFDPVTIKIEADVCVKNQGTIPIEKVKINHKFLDGVACGYYVYNEMFESLFILPGDSLWISCGIIHNRWHFLPSEPGDTIRLNLCVYTSNPNGIVDLNVANDNVCELKDIGFVGINNVMNQNKPNKIIKTVDILGRECKLNPNMILFNIYENGEVEKIIRLE